MGDFSLIQDRQIVKIGNATVPRMGAKEMLKIWLNALMLNSRKLLLNTTANDARAPHIGGARGAGETTAAFPEIRRSG
jgi:hypothetical protein